MTMQWNRQLTSLAALLALATTAALPAQDQRPVAFTNARIVTVSGAPIERGTLVIKNGKIEAVGANVTVPAGARIIDASGKTLMPGLVSAWSRAGMQPAQPRFEEAQGGGRRRGGQPQMQGGGGGGGTQNRAATKVVDGLYSKQTVFAELLRQGVTTLALNPSGGGFPGLGAILRPDGTTLEQLTADDDAFLQIGMVRDGATKKLLKETFEKAQKIVAERKKPPEPPAPPPEAKPTDGKPAEVKPGDKPAEKPPEGKEPPKGEQPPKPEPGKQDPPKPEDKKDAAAAPAKKPEPPKDPNLEVIADLLEGKRRALVQIDSAADLLHWQNAVADEVKFPRALVLQRHDPLSGTYDVVLDQLKAMQCPVLLPPELSTLPRSRYLIHPARVLHEAGIEIAFVVGDNQPALRSLFYRLMEQVRCGLPADIALRAVTLQPAKMLGVDGKKGSLEVGKDADLLVFQGDPLTPAGQLEAVWLQGREVPPSQ